MATQMVTLQQTLFGIAQTARRWSVSNDTIRRAADAGAIKTVQLGARRMVPLTEIERIEREGFGQGRKRGEKRTKKAGR